MRLGNTNVHAARERPCDIALAYDCFRCFVLGRVLSRSAASLAKLPTFRTYRVALKIGLSRTRYYLEMAALHPGMTIWPSGLRRQLQVLVRKGVGSNPTVVTYQPVI